MAIYHKSLHGAATPLTGLRAFGGRRRPLRRVIDTPGANCHSGSALQDSPCLTDDSFIVAGTLQLSQSISGGHASLCVVHGDSAQPKQVPDRAASLPILLGNGLLCF